MILYRFSQLHTTPGVQGQLMERSMSNNKSKCCRSIIGSVKGESTRGSVKCSSNTVALMANQTLTGHNKGESLRTKMVSQPVTTRCSSSQNSNSKTKMARNKIYKRTESFQPCKTCKQIVENRKTFVEFRLTPEGAGDSTTESESITTQAIVDKPCSKRENGGSITVHLPTIGNDTVDDSKLELRPKVSSKTYDSGFTKQRSKSYLEKSNLVKSKERIEKKLLQARRKHLYHLVRQLVNEFCSYN